MFCLDLWYSVQKQMQLFSCHHMEQHIYNQNDEITIVQEIHILDWNY
jgi:hypothetical protein